MAPDAVPGAPPAKAAATKKAAPPAKKARGRAPKMPAGAASGVGRPSKAELVAFIAGKIADWGGYLQLGGELADNDVMAYDGRVIEAQAPVLAERVYELSLKSPAVANIVDQWLKGSSKLSIVGDILATALPIAVAHGKLPESAIRYAGARTRTVAEAAGPLPERKPKVRPEPAPKTEATDVPAAPAPWRSPASPEALVLRFPDPEETAGEEATEEPAQLDHPGLGAELVSGIGGASSPW